LEGGGTVGHFKEHHKGFKEAAIGMEGCLPFVSGLDSYVIETPLNVKLCEVLGSAELEDKFGDKGEGVPVLDGYSVQRADLRRLGFHSGDQFNSMIPLAVLRQYVKVFFGEHGLELCDIGGQWSGDGLRLFATSGSLHKTLGGRSHSSEVGLGELR